jgi:hypothetical protein
MLRRFYTGESSVSSHYISMNWTGGRLQRHGHANQKGTSLQRKQKEHFAKIRTRLQGPGESLSFRRANQYAPSKEVRLPLTRSISRRVELLADHLVTNITSSFRMISNPRLQYGRVE